MFENTMDQKNKHVLDVFMNLNSMKVLLSEATEQLAKVEQPLLSISYGINAQALIKNKMLKIIYASLEHSVERVIDDIVATMESYSSEYVEGELSEQLSLWKELCYVLHSEEYFYDQDFLFNLSTQFLNETDVTNYTEFTDASESQKSFGETVFSIIEEHRKKLKDFEKAFIWGLGSDSDGNDWFFSTEDHELDLSWDNDFIDNHLYSLLLSKAQQTQGVH